MNKSRLGVTLIFSLNGFLYANWVSRLPRLQEQFGLDHSQLGSALLGVSMGALLSMPLTGRLIVRTGSQQLTRISAFLLCLFTPLIPWMPNYVALITLFFGLGLTMGTLDVSMNAQAVLVEAQLKKPIMASFHAWFSAGMMLGAGSGAWFNWLEWPLIWHLPLVAVLALSVALWATRQLITDQRAPVAASATTTQAAPVRKFSPQLVSLGLVAFCCMMAEGAMADWSANYLEKVALAGRYWAPIGLAAFTAAMTGGRFLGDKLRLVLGDERLLQVGSLTAWAGLALALLWPITATGVAGFFLVGLGLSSIVPIAYSTAGKAPGLPPGLGISAVSTIGYAGFLLGPPIIGYISDWYSLRAGLGVVCALLAVMVVLTLRLSAPKVAATTAQPAPLRTDTGD